jgi:hypothetical protein
MDEYGVCPHCLWNGKVRNDGTIRRHHQRSQAEQGRTGRNGEMPQDKHLPLCTGEGEQPYDPLSEMRCVNV